MRLIALLLVLIGSAVAFVPQPSSTYRTTPVSNRRSALFLSDNGSNNNMETKVGGYTVKQRLREEVESPFRTVRLYFFGFSTISAVVALYFSLLTAFKSYTGAWSDVPPLDEALQSCGINVASLLVCGFLTFRDWKAGEANLTRIAKGGALARLVVTPADEATSRAVVTTLADYRRNARVLIAAGGADYISTLCRSLNADQLADENTLPVSLAASEVIVVPVLLEGDGTIVGDAAKAWSETTPEEGDRNLDTTRANSVLAFPRGTGQWEDFLKSEVETAKKQGFDVMSKGFTILVKKNGKILRRATGQPSWGDFLGMMEVLDGSKFGMPGDDAKYGS